MLNLVNKNKKIIEIASKILRFDISLGTNRIESKKTLKNFKSTKECRGRKNYEQE